MHGSSYSSLIRSLIVILLAGIILCCWGAVASTQGNGGGQPEINNDSPYHSAESEVNQSVNTYSRPGDKSLVSRISYNGDLIDARETGPGLPPPGWIINANLSNDTNTSQIKPANGDFFTSIRSCINQFLKI